MAQIHLIFGLIILNLIGAIYLTYNDNWDLRGAFEFVLGVFFSILIILSILGIIIYTGQRLYHL